MGKGAEYVFLAFFALVALAAACWGLARLGKDLHRHWQAARLNQLRRTTPWKPYTHVDDLGYQEVGVARRAEYRNQLHVFEGPIKLFSLPPDVDPIDGEDKVRQAKDRAYYLNLVRQQEVGK